MKDFLLRILIGSLVGAVVSGGILYFAFDQSLRGMETAVETTNERISDNGDLIRDVGADIQKLEITITNKLDVLASNSRADQSYVLENIHTIALQQYDHQASLIETIRAVHATLAAVPLNGYDDTERDRIAASLADLQESEKKLDALHSEWRGFIQTISMPNSASTNRLATIPSNQLDNRE